VLIDHQPYQFANLNSHEPTMIVNNVIGLAKTAKSSTCDDPDHGDRGTRRLSDQGASGCLAGAEADRPHLHQHLADERVVDIVKKSGRKQLVLAALYTRSALAMPAIQALAEGYDVFIVTDASGASRWKPIHGCAPHGCRRSGADHLASCAGRVQRDWAARETAAGVAGVVAEHGGASGVAFGLELQVLAGRAGAGA